MTTRRGLILGASALCGSQALAQGVPGITPGLGLMATSRFTSWNPSQKGAAITLSNNNLTATNTDSSLANETVLGLDGYAAGNHYCEWTVNTCPATSDAVDLGVTNGANGTGVPTASGNGIVYRSDGIVSYNGGAVTQSGTPTFTAGDVIGVQVIVGSGVKFYKNGVLAGTGFYTNLSTAQTLYPCFFSIRQTAAVTINRTPVYPPVGATYWGN